MSGRDNFALNGTKTISVRATNGFIKNLIIGIAKINYIDNPQIKILSNRIECLEHILNTSFEINDNCVITGLRDDFKCLICDAVNNFCPYYCGDGNRGMNINSLNTMSSDGDISLFHEEIFDDDNFLNSDISSIITTEQHNEKGLFANFVSKNLNTNDYLANDNLKIINIDKIEKGKWMLNGNITIEIPKMVNFTTLKLFVYLNDNVVSSGEIVLGSHDKTNSNVIKTFPFNMMFVNDVSGKDLKIALIASGNKSNLTLLSTTSFYANLMNSN